jgi:hypothetical protein
VPSVEPSSTTRVHVDRAIREFLVALERGRQANRFVERRATGAAAIS